VGDVKQRSKTFRYTNTICWQEAKKGILSSPDKPEVTVATPPEFLGHAGFWTPEDLFVASVNSCIMTTFIYYAEKNCLDFLSYESRAEGVLERVNDRFMFSEIKITPQILVKQNSDIQKAKDIVELSEKNCLISNSIKSKVTVSPVIVAESFKGGG